MLRLRPILTGFVVLAFLALACLPWAAWLGARVDLAHALNGPSFAHPFGTDNVGRDLLVRLAGALRGGVLPLWGVVIASTALGGGAGFLSLAASARWSKAVAAFDAVAAVVASVPVGLTAFAWAAVYAEAGLLPVAGALAPLFAVRAYLQLRDLYRHDAQLAFWTAHQAMGGGLCARLWTYGVATGWRQACLESLGFHLRAAVAIEASLSYLGFGIQEPQASFGNILAAHLDLVLKGQWSVSCVVAAGLGLAAAFPGSLLALARNGMIGEATPQSDPVRREARPWSISTSASSG